MWKIDEEWRDITENLYFAIGKTAEFRKKQKGKTRAGSHGDANEKQSTPMRICF